MHPIHHARTMPDKAAYIMAGTGETVTYGQLDERANQGAHLFRSLGLKRGDSVAVFMDNSPRYFELLFATERAGLYITCISSKLTAGEIEYIVRDSGSKVFVASTGVAAMAIEAAALFPELPLFMCDGAVEPFASFEEARAAFPTTMIDDPSPGMTMLYSSGTTGRPKGVRRPLPEGEVGAAPGPLMMLHVGLYGATPDSIYLSPAPLYHAAPLGWTAGMLQLGGTVVVMEKFDPELALKYIEKYKVTTAQWVPTHFVRMLKLPEEVRTRYDVSTLQAVFHAAAPCPVPIKEQMIDWWGPIIHEYYAGTEGNGLTAINSQEWLAHKGSVGKGMTAEVKICDEEGNPLPPRQEGGVYFAGGGAYEYHNDPKKTAEAKNQHGWTTLGDVGWLDEEGYLYLTDRKSFMIISGGVNIYPQEIENLLVTHPKVADVAVIGAPDEEMGEKVVAIIQPADWSEAGDALAEELSAFVRANLSGVKRPRQIDFMEQLPRHDTGKIYKRLIRDAYWGKTDAKIA
ncbi:MAG: acyl-CoA synthetase [Caulobacter sp.]|nr:acyl-CoA synthetase [Caulobacter sp.]